MNPPSAIQGAMSRDRKPFTYTPGGLDLSEIKSERMAKRLMRNAMNQGVPEVPANPIQSPMSSNPVALPNYNCLPVQVFPSFNLPANPKTLLRTRSNPDPKDSPIQRVFQPTFVNNTKTESNDTFNKNTPTYSQINNNRPVSMYEYSTVKNNANTLPRMNYGSDGYTAPVLPEISYDAEYFRVPPKLYNDLESEKLRQCKLSAEQENISTKDNLETRIDVDPIPTQTVGVIINPTVPKPAVVNVGSDNEQREVKVIKKEAKKESKVEQHNGVENGNGNVEAELTVQLPTKKSAAKTETKVEIVKNILPDGSVQEVKTTTTKTTIDGRTEIKTKTETTTIPKEEDDTEEVVEEGEEENGDLIVQEVEDEEEEEEVVEQPKKTVVKETTSSKQNGDDNIIKTEERSETTTTTTKKVEVVEESPKEEVVEEEDVVEEDDEVEDVEPVTVVIKKQEKVEPVEVEEEEEEEVVENEEKVKEEETKEVKTQVVTKTVEAAEEVEDEEIEEEEEEEVEIKTKAPPPKDDGEDEEQEEEEEYEEAEEKQIEVEKKETEESETKEEVLKVEEKMEAQKVVVEELKPTPKEEPQKEEVSEKKEPEETKPEPKQEKQVPSPQPEPKIPLREPSIPLEKVEDVEIKPIGLGPALVTKSHTENTEIITSTINPQDGLSTQTEYNKVENIVTVNRTTKILENNYENLTQQGIPTVKTYFAPPTIDRISTSPLPTRPYQPVYPPEPTTERRHSLLLERLSVERQMPVDTYQYNNQTYEQQTQYQDDPRAEVLTVSNVKPSKITNQQWYQQSTNPNAVYNPPSTPTPPSWTKPKPQQQTYQPQYQPPQTQTQLSPSPQPQTQYQPTPQPQYQPSLTPQYQPSPTPQYQQQPQYQPSYTETTDRTQTKTYTSYTPKPTWVSNVDSLPSLTQPSQYLYNKDTTESYQNTTKQYSSSYVPPPWEQDSSYVSDNTPQNYYQPPPQTTFTPTPSQNWKPPPSAKYTKPTPIAYIPPPPNKSFVKAATNVEPPKMPGSKTYYSEYERRYITVPESTYVPTETKYQPQPDPSPQYYYDNNEPTEAVEPQWRKELREFTEKTTTTTTQTEQSNVQPPWEADPKYEKTTPATYTATPTWSQTLRPRSWRERSFESEYVGSQEWPKTNTLGRGRPLSSFNKGVDTIPERPRGVSVDRYNPNSYQSPAEHPPVQTHTLTTPAPRAGYHNPNVPAYHSRASAEPREHTVSYQQRVWRESRASPIQSRSFKYLQWITGTEN